MTDTCSTCRWWEPHERFYVDDHERPGVCELTSPEFRCNQHEPAPEGTP